MHAKTQMNSEDTKMLSGSSEGRDVCWAEHLSCRRDTGLRYVLPSAHLSIDNTILTQWFIFKKVKYSKES